MCKYGLACEWIRYVRAVTFPFKSCSWYITDIITLVRHKTPGLTQKCLVRHKNTWFDTKMTSSTQKYMVQHKNAQFHTKMPYQACIRCLCHNQNSLLPVRIFFSTLFIYFVFRTHRGMINWIIYYYILYCISYYIYWYSDIFDIIMTYEM